MAPTDDGFIGYKGRRLLSILNKKKLERVLGYLLDENEFLGTVRNPLSVSLPPGPSVLVLGWRSGVQGGLPAGRIQHRNVRRKFQLAGPVWMPVNMLIVRALLNLYAFYGDEFKVQCPTGSGHYMTLFEVAEEIQRRLGALFVATQGKRPVYGARRSSRRSALARPDFVL